MKVLITANQASFFNKFLKPYINYYKENGSIVDIACNGDEVVENIDKRYSVCFSRSMFSLDNFKSIKQLKKIVKENNYDLILCHTPMAGMATRMVNLKHKYNVIYTAHGFHFYKGAPLLNWVLFYPIEKFLSRFTNKIITITKEDYSLVKDKFHCKIYYIPSIGVDIEKFSCSISKKEIENYKKEFNIKNEKVLLFAGELNKNKNQKFLIECMKDLDNTILLLAGNGSYLSKYEQMIKDYNLEDKVKLLGFRKDINKLLCITDIVVSSSYREGLPVNILEAMAHNIPVVASNNRGHRELISNKKNGYIYEVDNKEDFIKKIKYFYKNDIDKKYNENKLKEYDIKQVLEEMVKIYG